jgi:hypothetical protein
MGPDTNLYVAGGDCTDTTGHDFTVVSLTPSGAERWVYRYDGPGGWEDIGYSIALGPDGNLYAAGYSVGELGDPDFFAVSLTTSGDERWVYRYNGPSWAGWDVANTIAVDPGGNIYAAGRSAESTGSIALVVISLTSAGEERWVYRYRGPGSQYDEANSIAVGPDNNLYVAGVSGRDVTHGYFMAVSLTELGEERWVYRYDGPGFGIGHSIVTGTDSNIYAAGYTRGTGASYDFTVVSLTALGAERWKYVYSSVQNSIDRPNWVTFGSDGILYAAGHTWVGDSTFSDIIVLSLSPDVGVTERLNRWSVPGSRLSQNTPNPFRCATVISYSLPSATEATLSIYDITGRLVETLVNQTKQPGIHQVRWNRQDNPSGVYYHRLRAGEFVETRKMVVVE